MKKINVIALLAFLAAAVFVIMMDANRSRAIQDKVMNLLSPFIRGSGATEKTVRNILQEPVNAATLQNEVESLNKKVAYLHVISQKYDQVLQENNKFRSMLGYQANANFKLSAARVLRRSASNWWNTLIIDKGAVEGIGTDSPVITDVGLVGKTGKVTTHSAEVILLTDEECRVAARIEGTQAKGIVSGERGGAETRPDLRLRFLDRGLRIESGANVYSSGDGGVFPAGLLLGKVKSFQIKDVSGEASVEPAVDFALLEDVFVVQMDSIPAAP
jgi:rod shape-determining protein MreC